MKSRQSEVEALEIARAATMTARNTWKSSFDLIKKMRSVTPAPVDTIGCASLFDTHESPQVLIFFF